MSQGSDQRGNLQFRQTVRTDNPRVLQLFRASFGREVRADVWDWLNHQCPTGENRTYVVEDLTTGTFAGSYSLLPVRLRYNGQLTNHSYWSLCS
jgi:hypothetical protein